MVPARSVRRARHLVPPPSTPRSRTLEPTGVSMRLLVLGNASNRLCGPAFLAGAPMDTERPSPRYADIDVWDPADILDAMIEGQFAAVAAVRAVLDSIERAAAAIEGRLSDGGRLVYAGAGTSGRLAVQDGAELMPTFNWPRERLLLLMAGGDQAMVRAVEGAEDERWQADELIRRHQISSRDALVAVAASG